MDGLRDGRKWNLLLGVVFLLSVLFLSGREGYAWLASGQDADIVVNSTGFNNAGYLKSAGDGLFFNHPGNVATDGTRLLLADLRNNRVLLWKSLPSGNVAPDLVLGQDTMTTNNQGTGLNRLNWPVGVATGGGKVVVADTYNHRVLIWTSFPTRNGQAADLRIDNFPAVNPSQGFDGAWPWGVWTDGTKLIVCATQARQVWIWNTFPTVNNQHPDIILTGKGSDGRNSFGTPRSIGTDGKTYLLIGDHNVNAGGAGSFLWRTFPTSDQPYDFIMDNPAFPGLEMWGGEKTTDGKLVILTPPGISIWNSLPATATQKPDLFVGRQTIRDIDEGCTKDGYHMDAGDASHIVIAKPSGKVYVSLDNGNRIVGYNALPTKVTQCPDFVIGAPDINTNPYLAASLVDNAVPATDGSALVATSGINYRLKVWSALPAASGIKPDITSDLGNLQANTNALWGSTFVAAGTSQTEQEILLWKTFPPDGEPDTTYTGGIGTTHFQNITGIGLDDKYLYVADQGTGKLHVWNSLPGTTSAPAFSLSLSQIGKISSDGKYLAVIDGSAWTVRIYDVATLSASASPLAVLPAQGAGYRFRSAPGPTGVLVAGGHLFISDDCAGRVLAWKTMADVLAGHDPDVVLGQPDLNQPLTEGIGTNRLFWPAYMAFDGARLWVGEFKFGGRLMAFPTTTAPYFVNASVRGGHGTVSPASQTAGKNGSASITISPSAGYRIATIVDNGVPVKGKAGDRGKRGSFPNPYVIGNVGIDHNVVVTFEKNYTFTATITGTGTLSGPGLTCQGTTCSGSYEAGVTATITATAGAGYAFAYWSGACSGASPVCRVVMNRDVAAGALFDSAKTRQYKLTVTARKVNGGAGTVASGDGMITCTGTCAKSYYPDTPVTLSATPGAGSVFQGWAGACSGTGACTVKMNKVQAVTATFIGPQRLTLIKQGVNRGTGTVTSDPAGLSCGETCTGTSHSYAYGRQVTLTAVAAGQSVFRGWAGACSGTGTCKVTMSAARSVTAVFTGPYNLKVTKVARRNGTGTVTSAPIGITCGTSCQSLFSFGTTVTLTAVAGANTAFTGWSPATVCSGTKPCVVKINGAKSVTAVFTGK